MLILKKCTKCGEMKSILDFYKDRKKYKGGRKKLPTNYGRVSQCKACYRKYERSWKDRNRNSINAGQRRRNKLDQSRKSYLKWAYGITLQQYNKILIEQNHVCAICGEQNIRNHKLDIDHDHKTKRIRGLLCRKCNVIIGLAKDNPQHLLKIVQYLIRSKDDADADIIGRQSRFYPG